MNTNYKIKETHVSYISSFEDRKIKPGLKTSTHNNKIMNHDNRTCTLDSPVQHNRSESPRMRSSTSSLKNKPGLKKSILMNNKTMNHDNRTYILDEPVPHIGVATLSPTPFRSIIRSLRDTARKAANTAKIKWNEYYDWLSTYVPPPIRVPTNSLEGSALMNNTILDEPVPDIGVETLRPTPFRRRVQSLKDTTRKVVNKVKKKMDFLL